MGRLGMRSRMGSSFATLVSLSQVVFVIGLHFEWIAFLSTLYYVSVNKLKPGSVKDYKASTVGMHIFDWT